MTKNFAEMRRLLAESERNTEARKDILFHAVQNCKHEWTKPVADHIYHAGYRIPGDPPGTMGVDWRGPVDVPSKTENRWRRECEICGEVQYTSDTTKEVTEHPKFY